MTLKVRYVGQLVIIDIRGKITVGSGDVVLRRELCELLNSERRHILLNLVSTTYVDSWCLSELVACYRRATEQNGMIKLLSPPGRIRDLLRVTRLDDVFEIYPAEDAALASFVAAVPTKNLVRADSTGHSPRVSLAASPCLIPKTLALLEPDDLWPAWRMIDLLEEAGEMRADEATAGGKGSSS